MANKQFQLQELTITIYKRKANRSLRLSVSPSGDIRVSIPTWTPYAAGIKFAESRLEWIRRQLDEQPTGLLKHGQQIGKAHRIEFVPQIALAAISTRIQGGRVIVSYPATLDSSDTAVQLATTKASIRALRTQAQQLLPIRLKELAGRENFDYKSVKIKHLKSRWGSCDQQGNITLNLFLMQLPWEQIDYVLLHELVHTKVMRHGPPFWQEMERVLPAARNHRRIMRNYHPVLGS